MNKLNKIDPGSASMPKFKQFNKDTSAAYKRYIGSSYEPDGEMVQETPYGRDPNFIKRRNQQTYEFSPPVNCKLGL